MYGPCFSSIVGGHPLRSPTRHRLGAPLPHQLADGTQAPPKVAFAFPEVSLAHSSTWGISSPFELLSPALGQVTNALLTRSPLSDRSRTVRLACIRHAASVHPEPGSNSPQKFFSLFRLLLSQISFDRAFVTSYHCSVVKVPPFPRSTCAPGERKYTIPAPRLSRSQAQKTDASLFPERTGFPAMPTVCCAQPPAALHPEPACQSRAHPRPLVLLFCQ